MGFGETSNIDQQEESLMLWLSWQEYMWIQYVDHFFISNILLVSVIISKGYPNIMTNTSAQQQNYATETSSKMGLEGCSTEYRTGTVFC